MFMDLEEQYDKIYRYCYMKIGNRQTAEDITQETFLRFLENENYQDMGKRLAYLYTIARNLCMDYFRKPQLILLDEEISVETDEEGIVSRISLKRAVSVLEEWEQELLFLRFVNEVTASSIGELTGQSRFSVHRRINRILAKLKKELGGSSRRFDCADGAGVYEIIKRDGGIFMELVIDRLTKQYQNKIAVDRISLNLGAGVHGLLGANGAGKTTLMRMVCGILKPTGGSVMFDGIDVADERYRDGLGYLPQDFGYYPNFTGWDFLLYMCALKGIDKKRAEKRARELLEIVGLEGMEKKKIRTYSGGMKQRLGIAQALLNYPRLIIFDEPTAGLDPKERVRFRNLIAKLGKENIVILSTHIVSDVEHIADRILMMKDGQIIFNGNKEDVGKDLEEFYLEQFGEVSEHE